MGHGALLQGVPRISSVSTLVQETVATFGVHERVFFKTPRLPQLSVHPGAFHGPKRKGSRFLDISGSINCENQVPKNQNKKIYLCSFHNNPAFHFHCKNEQRVSLCRPSSEVFLSCYVDLPHRRTSRSLSSWSICTHLKGI